MKKSLLPHYNALLDGKDTAYYLLCRKIPAFYESTATLEELWDVHNDMAKNFRDGIQNGHINRYQSVETSYLDLKIEIGQRILENCEFCENQCKINRKIGGTGYCGMSEVSRVSSAFMHHGEEPPLVPSGTIFFAGCSFGCVFCQNYEISTIGKDIPFNQGGSPVDGKQLAGFAEVLTRQGAKNINYVGGDPTPNLHTIIESMKYQTQNITQLWNSNFYNTIKTLNLLKDLMDFWLPDFKFGNNNCGMKYSKVSNYWDVLTRNLKYIYCWGSRDIIIRHLVMPGHFECCTKPILEWISQEIPGTAVNIMGQYHPEHKVDSKNYLEINRRVSRSEMIEAFSLAERLKIPYKFMS
jgi:putative pyruvate formate lyase activating enzyme